MQEITVKIIDRLLKAGLDAKDIVKIMEDNFINAAFKFGRNIWRR